MMGEGAQLHKCKGGITYVRMNTPAERTFVNYVSERKINVFAKLWKRRASAKLARRGTPWSNNKILSKFH